MCKPIWTLAVLLVLSGPAYSDEDEKTKVFLELDYFGNPERTVPEPEELNRWFDAAGFQVEGQREQNEDLDTDGCIDKALVEEWLDKTRSAEPPEDSWYAHGLVLPHKCVTLWNKRNEDENYSYQGLLWPLGGGEQSGRREAFVILDGLFGTSEESLRSRMFVFGHELAHVLNAHHCEFTADGWDNYEDSFGEWSLQHFKQKETNPDEVMPGGDAWCKVTEWHEEAIHGEIGCGDDCGELKTRVYDSPQLVTLTVDKEKDLYFPGEPIYVGLTLSADSRLSGKLYYEKGSLDPASPNLSFSVGRSDAGMTPLRRAILGHRELKLKELNPGDTVTREHLDVWFTLPEYWVEWNPATDRAKPLWIRASYTMFEPTGGATSCDGAAISNCQRVRIDSEPVRLVIRIDPAVFPEKNHRRFTSPEARRFLWLRGGDHLTEGKKALRKVTKKKRDKIFRPYADLGLALGIFSRRRVLEDEDLEEARKRLEEAKKVEGGLSPWHQKLLEEQLTGINNNSRQ